MSGGGARRVEVLAFNPGLMLDTGLVAGAAGRAAGAVAWALSPVLRCTPLGRLMRSAPASGADLAHVATAPLARAASSDDAATYYDGRRPHLTSSFSRSAVGARAAAALWRHSLRWAAVSPEELVGAGFSATT